MEQYNYQEPCCIERTLPALLREHPMSAWQSNGDVTFDRIIKAVSLLAGNSLNIILVHPAPELPIVQCLAWYHRRGWLNALTILTQTEQTTDIRKEFPNDFPIEILTHKSVTDGLLIIQGEKGQVIVQGPLHAAVVPNVERFTTYAGNDKDSIAMLTATTLSRIAVLRRKKSKNKTAPTTTSTDECPNPQ